MLVEEDGVPPEKCQIRPFEATINLTNLMFGAGIVGMPYAVSKSGAFLGPLVVVGCAAAVHQSFQLLVRAAQQSSTSSYSSLMRACFGTAGDACHRTFQALVSFGSICVELVMIADNLEFLLSKLPAAYQWLASRQTIVIAVSAACLLPLSMVRKMDGFAWMSGVSVASLLLLVATSVYCSLLPISDCLPSAASKNSFLMVVPSGVVDTAGVVCFALICHGIVIGTYRSLACTNQQWSRLCSVALSICCVAFIVVGVAVYWKCGDRLLQEGNFVNLFSTSSPIASLLRAVLSVSLVMSIPLEAFVLRKALLAQETSSLVDGAVNSAVIAAASAIAILCGNVGELIEVTGGMTASCLAFVFPPVCYLVTLEREVGWKKIKDKRACIALMLFGVLVFLLSSVTTVKKIEELSRTRIISWKW